MAFTWRAFGNRRAHGLAAGDEVVDGFAGGEDFRVLREQRLHADLGGVREVAGAGRDFALDAQRGLVTGNVLEVRGGRVLHAGGGSDLHDLAESTFLPETSSTVTASPPLKSLPSVSRPRMTPATRPRPMTNQAMRKAFFEKSRNLNVGSFFRNVRPGTCAREHALVHGEFLQRARGDERGEERRDDADAERDAEAAQSDPCPSR